MSGYQMFDEMTAAIREDTVRILMHIRVEQKVEREPAAKVTGPTRTTAPPRHRLRETKPRFIQTIRVHAVPVRNINSAAAAR